MSRKEPPAVTLETLSSLAGVRRFDMAVMFMSSSEKKGELLQKTHLLQPFPHIDLTLLCSVITELFDFLLQSQLDQTSVEALKKKYGV